MDVKKIRCLQIVSLHVPIWLTVSETERDIGRKSSFFHTTLAFDAPVWFRICWCPCLQKVKIYQQTKFRRHQWSTYIYLWLRYNNFWFQKTNVRHIGIGIGFWSLSLSVICISFCIALPNFVQIRAPTAEIWHHFHFSRWRPRPLNTSSDFVFVDVTVFKRSKSISKINFIDISQLTTTSVFEKQTSVILEIYFRFRFRPFARNLHIILHQATNFVQIETPTAEIWRHIHFSRWRPRRLNTTSGFI